MLEETDKVLYNLIISAAPDGDHYTNSKLYKIEGVNTSKDNQIKEEKFSDFSIIIEHGFHDKRKFENI